MKRKPIKIVTTKYYEELDSDFPPRTGQPGTAGRRIREETTTETRRWWYTEDEWSKHIGWGKLPKEYAKPEEEEEEEGWKPDPEFDYRDEDHPHESWDQYIVRKNQEIREKKVGDIEDELEAWFHRLIHRIRNS